MHVLYNDGGAGVSGAFYSNTQVQKTTDTSEQQLSPIFSHKWWPIRNWCQIWTGLQEPWNTCIHAQCPSILPCLAFVCSHIRISLRNTNFNSSRFQVAFHSPGKILYTPLAVPRYCHSREGSSFIFFLNWSSKPLVHLIVFRMPTPEIQKHYHFLKLLQGPFLFVMYCPEGALLILETFWDK